MEGQLFRQKSLERISSPEALNDYMHVTTPSVWLLLAAVLILLAGLFIWSGFASIESRATGIAVVKDGTMTVSFADAGDVSNVEAGMTAYVGGNETQITYIGLSTADGTSVIGVEAQIPDGTYDFSAVYRTTKVMEMLFN